MVAGVTINGMLMADPTLFDGLVLPAGLSRDVLVDTISFSYGDLYMSNTDPAWTKAAITLWGQRHKFYLDELFKTLSYEYNPIENYDRQETWTDTTSEQHSLETGGSTTGTDSGTTGTTTSATTQHDLSAYNAATFQPDSKNTDNGTTSGTSSGTHETETEGTESGTRSGTTTHTARVHGNIGVTTSQQMIEAQRKVIMISWYDEAAALFASEFCLMIY